MFYPLIAVNLIQGTPSTIRVMGRVTGCAGYQVDLQIWDQAGPPAGAQLTALQQGVPVDVFTDRFVADLPVTAGGVQAGMPVTVVATCPSGCNDEWLETLEDCQITITGVQTPVAPPSLTPFEIIVSGVAYGCPGDHVVAVVQNVGQSPSAPVRQLDGGFNAVVQVPPGVSVVCGQILTVSAFCAQSPNSCVTPPERLELYCPGCFRAEAKATPAATCTGSPPTRDYVLTATVNVPPGQTINFCWDFGDGSGLSAPPLTVTNNTSDPYAALQLPPVTHVYAPGTYTASLNVCPPTECEPAETPSFTVQCPTDCPTLTGTVIVPPCTDGTRPPVDLQLDFNPPLPPGTLFNVSWSPGNGSAVQTSGTVQQGSTLATLTRQVSYPANQPFYPSATVAITVPGQTCSPSLVNFEYPAAAGSVTIPPCPGQPPCHQVSITSDYQNTCLDEGDRLSVRFTASTTPNTPAYAGTYEWNVSRSGSVFRGPVIQPPPTQSNVFDHTFTGPGTYSVSVTIRNTRPPCPSDVATASLPISIPPCSGPPQVTGCGVTAGNPGSITISFNKDLDPTTATNPGNYSVSVAGGAPQTPSTVGYDPATRTATLSGINVAPGQTVVVTVAGVTDTTGTPIGAQNTTTCNAPQPPTVTGCAASAGTPGSVTVSFDMDLDAASAANPANYSVSVAGGAPQTPSTVSYDPATRTAILSGINVTPGQTVAVTVTGVANSTGTPIGAQNTTTCNAPQPPPPPNGGGGGIDLCCVVIWAWGIAHLVTGSLLFFGLWWGALVAGIIATILLIIWIAACCWPCALTFWRCCTLLRWMVMFNDTLLILFGLYAVVSGGNPYVAAGFAAASGAFRAMMAASRCGGVPNIFDSTTWPSCRCP